MSDENDLVAVLHTLAEKLNGLSIEIYQLNSTMGSLKIAIAELRDEYYDA